MARGKTYRVQLDFQQSSMARLRTLKDKTEAASYAEVIRNALRLYETVIEDVEKGKQFFTRDEQGVITLHQFFRR